MYSTEQQKLILRGVSLVTPFPTDDRQTARVNKEIARVAKDMIAEHGNAAITMPTNNDSNELLGLTEKIVSSHVSNNAVSSADLPDLIKTVYAALGNVKTAGEAPPTPEPAVPIKRSVTPNFVICLEDGRKMKMLKRHLKTAYNMTPAEYRVRWGLPSDYPMVAPKYAEKRSQLAKQIGLGTKNQMKRKAAGKK